MTTMTTNLSPATPTPSLFKRFLNWFRGTKPVAPVASTFLPTQEQASEPIEGASTEQQIAPVAPPAKVEDNPGLRKLIDADHSARGYHEGRSRGDKHFMDLSIASICSELQEAVLDGIDQKQTALAKLEQERKKLQEHGLHDVALKFGPQIQRIQKDIEELHAQLPLVTEGRGWAYLPVTTYRNAFHKAQTEKATELLQELTKPLL
jgi:hypothetical protein